MSGNTDLKQQQKLLTYKADTKHTSRYNSKHQTLYGCPILPEKSSDFCKTPVKTNDNTCNSVCNIQLHVYTDKCESNGYSKSL